MTKHFFSCVYKQFNNIDANKHLKTLKNLLRNISLESELSIFQDEYLINSTKTCSDIYGDNP